MVKAREWGPESYRDWNRAGETDNYNKKAGRQLCKGYYTKAQVYGEKGLKQIKSVNRIFVSNL